ncbi:hypothetical protein MKK65_29520 [Methylobacterium sp. J-001]|uniref:hypothetical protein n=1 Tax=Methylobacterium sp. J-001 TaxID=2836609 RepID=UPI001FB8BC60|nr:hypothetical protein [Methylobacterium sp. J-001]MCJ2120648.1 hypothetical protein [Methylobacterium sp. J-001]
MALPSDTHLSKPSEVLSDREAQFVALTPSLLVKLVEFDRLWAESSRLYDEARQAHPRPDPEIFGSAAQKGAAEAIGTTPEWQAYLASREPTDELDSQLDAVLLPFMDEPMVSFPAILLKCRIGMSLRQYQDDAVGDLERLAKEVLCA